MEDVKKMPKPFDMCSGPVTDLRGKLPATKEHSDGENPKHERCLKSEAATRKSWQDCEDLLEAREKLANTCGGDDTKNEYNACVPRDADVGPTKA